MEKKIELKVFVDLLSQKNRQKDIKLKVEGKVLKNGQRTIKLKSLIVSEKLFNELGLEEEAIMAKPNKTIKKPSLRDDINEMKEIMLNGFKDVKKDITIIKEDIKAMKNTPTMKRELNVQKKVKSLKQKP